VGLFVLYAAMSFGSFVEDQNSKLQPVDYNGPLTIESVQNELGDLEADVVVTQNNSVFVNIHKDDIYGWKLNAIQMDTTIMFSKLFNDPRIETAVVRVVVPDEDAFGNPISVTTAQYMMTKETASSINWDDWMDVQRHLNELADFVYIDPEVK
jgi:hypothetical protein